MGGPEHGGPEHGSVSKMLFFFLFFFKEKDEFELQDLFTNAGLCIVTIL